MHFKPTYVSIYRNIFHDDFRAHYIMHQHAIAWAKEHNIKSSPGPNYTLTTILEFTNNKDLLAFKLIFGELICNG